MILTFRVAMCYVSESNSKNPSQLKTWVLNKGAYLHAWATADTNTSSETITLERCIITLVLSSVTHATCVGRNTVLHHAGGNLPMVRRLPHLEDNAGITAIVQAFQPDHLWIYVHSNLRQTPPEPSK